MSTNLWLAFCRRLRSLQQYVNNLTVSEKLQKVLNAFVKWEDDWMMRVTAQNVQSRSKESPRNEDH